ncbi:crossover junction endodeoxyribonuclease RuvC [Candidatus Peregrinibacteria bacterium]|nr:MAG: crossover junction endodeoxyribonuclease RuvC [Candidatus Peregrinibacteria bacterium]
MIFLGIDPGLATVGFGAIEAIDGQVRFLDAGVFETPAHSDLGERLDSIRTDFIQILQELKPDVIGMEELYFAQNTASALKVAHARGVLVQVAFEHGIPLLALTPLQIKQNITGDGHADKWQVQEMVKRLLKLPAAPQPDDAADGVAIAMCTERIYASQLPHTLKP